MSKLKIVNFDLRKKIKNTILIRDIRLNKQVYLMLLPVIAYFIIFCYMPMYGAQIAFKNFSPMKGIWESAWVGFDHFEKFLNGVYFTRLLRNTFLINVYDVIFGFPAPVILALMINEVRNRFFKSTVQTISYMPHFISTVVMCNILTDFLNRNGLINNILNWFGIESIPFLQQNEWFRTVFVSSSIWQGVGWASIIYLSAISSIDQEQFEAAIVDGASRIKQALYITLPNIMPTVVIMLILRIGNMMNVGLEKVMLLYNPLTYDTADVISTYVYRKGILEADFSFSTAVGLFNSVINFVLLVIVNAWSKKATQTSLW